MDRQKKDVRKLSQHVCTQQGQPQATISPPDRGGGQRPCLQVLAAVQSRFRLTSLGEYTQVIS